MTADNTLAYIAGIIDGEGYIGIKKCGPRSYHERIQVRMVDEPAIALLAKTLGGNYYKEKPHALRGRPLFCYQASDRSACHILKTVFRFLRVKKVQAATVLKMRTLKAERRTKIVGTRNFPNAVGTQRMVNSMGFSDKNMADRELLYLQCKELNRVGC